MGFTHKSLGEKRGFSVAFLGQDGAGKSTISEDICSWLNWKIEAQKFYLGSGDHYHSVFKFFKSVLRQKNSLVKAIWAMLNIFDLASLSRHNLFVIQRARKYICKGGIVLYDRFPQNQFQGINDGPKIRQVYYEKSNNILYKKFVVFFARIEEKNIEKIIKFQPTVVIKLKLSPEESIRRKPEEDIENVNIKHFIIESLVFPLSENHTIDATMPYERELIEVKKIIWARIEKNSKEI